MAIAAKLQPRESSLTVTTDSAALKVQGTKFVVEHNRRTTRVAVFSGRVELSDASFSGATAVTSGRQGEVAAFGPPDVQPIPALRDFRRELFEHGLPAGATGEHVRTGLPSGSRGAVRTVFTDRYARNDISGHQQISVRALDMKGLFDLTKTSHLAITCRFEHLEWVNLFIGAMSLNPVRPRHHLYRYNKLEEQVGKAGVWKRVTIPFSAFRSEPTYGTGVFDGPPPSPDMTPITILLSYPVTDDTRDRGVVVDSIEVLPEGPGKVTVSPVH